MVPPAEVIDRRELVTSLEPGLLARPERLHFDLVLLVTAGAGRHMVDFATEDLRTGTLLWIASGQVQAWFPDDDYDATLVIFPSQPEEDSRRPWPGLRVRRWQLDTGEQSRVRATMDDLAGEVDAYDGTPTGARLVLAVLRVLLVRMERLPSPAASQGVLPPPYVALLERLEADFSHTRDVSRYAERLGYSARTLDRVCSAAAGVTAKAVIDARVLLEAKRLLAHTDDPVAAIAASLGFTEPTNFVKYFRRLEGTTPLAFRERQLHLRR